MKKFNIRELAHREQDRAFQAFAEVAPRKSRLRSVGTSIGGVVSKVKPKDGFSHFFHIIFVTVLPLALYVLVRIDFASLAIALVLLSKWRMFSVKARHWPANIRANAVDITVGVSTVLFMSKATSVSIQLLWVVAYIVWLLLIKPKSTVIWIGVQAMIGQAMGLFGLYVVYGRASVSVLVLITALLCYASARHYFSAFDETLGRTTAYVWAYFGASVTWLLTHWLIYYGVLAQPALIISLVGYTLAALYYLQHTDRLSKGTRRQFVIVLTAILIFLVVFSDWGDKTI